MSFSSRKHHLNTKYYENRIRLPNMKPLEREIDEYFTSPTQNTDAGQGYHEIDRWVDPLVKRNIGSLKHVGAGVSRRNDMIGHLDDHKIGKKMKHQDPSYWQAYQKMNTDQGKQTVVSLFNQQYKTTVDQKLHDYNQRFTQANSFWERRRVVRGQRFDSQLRQAQKNIINTRYADINEFRKFHKDYAITGDKDDVYKSKRMLKKANAQLTQWLKQDGIHIENTSDRRIRKTLKTGRLNGVELDDQKKAELREVLKIREHMNKLGGTEGIRDALKSPVKVTFRETIGKTDTARGYRTVKRGVKAAEMGTSAAMIGIEGITTASIGLTRKGASAYDFAYRKVMNNRIANAKDPLKKARRQTRLAEHNKWTKKVQTANDGLRVVQDKLHGARKKTTKFLNDRGSGKVKTVGRGAKKLAVGIDKLSGKVTGTKISTRISNTRLGKRVGKIRKTYANVTKNMKNKFTQSLLGNKLINLSKGLAKFASGLQMAKLYVIAGLAIFLILSAGSFAIVTALGNGVKMSPGATAEDETFLQGIVQDMQVRQDAYEDYILYGKNESGIDTSKVHSNGTFVNSVERSDIDTSSGLSKARIPVDFTATVQVTEEVTTYTYEQVADYADVPYTETKDKKEKKSHVHRLNETDPVCQGENATCVCSICEKNLKILHSCDYWLQTTETITGTRKEQVGTHEEQRVSDPVTNTSEQTRTVHGYANSTGLNAAGEELAVPNGGTLSDSQVSTCETEVTYKFVDSNGQSQYVDEEGVVHTYDQADLYKAILSMATVAINNDCDDKDFYEAYCFKLLDSVYNAGYSVNYTVTQNAGSNDVKWQDATDIKANEQIYDENGKLIKEINRTQDPTELSSDSYTATAEVIIYLDSGLTDLIKHDTTDNAWMRLNGTKTETYGTDNAGDYYPTYRGFKVVGYHDASGTEIDMNDPEKLPDVWEGWKNSDGSYNDNYDDALEYYGLDNEDWRDFDVILPGVLADGVLFANVASQAEVAAYLKQCGFSDAGIAGIMGNIQQESNWNPLSSNGHYSGLCQWDIGGRWDRLLSFCSANGLDYTTSSAQIAYMVYEMPSRCPKVYEYLKTTDDVAMAAMEFAMGFEGCVRSTAHEYDLLYTGTLYPDKTNKIYLQEMQKRVNYANTYYQVNTGSSTGSFTDIPAVTAAITNPYQKSAVSYALSCVGANYSQDLRFAEGYYDCSSLCYRSWLAAGIDISNGGSTTAAGIAEGFYRSGRTISFSDLQPGDMLFYSRKSNGRFLNITHVAMYVGDGMVVEARDEKHGVVYRAASATGLDKVVLIGRANYPVESSESDNAQ